MPLERCLVFFDATQPYTLRSLYPVLAYFSGFASRHVRRYWFQQYCTRGRKIWYKYLIAAHQCSCCSNLSVALAFSHRIICIGPLGDGFFAALYDITFPCLFQPDRFSRNFAFKSTCLNNKKSHWLTSRLSTRTSFYVAGRIYNLCANHSLNSGFDRT